MGVRLAGAVDQLAHLISNYLTKTKSQNDGSKKVEVSENNEFFQKVRDRVFLRGKVPFNQWRSEW